MSLLSGGRRRRPRRLAHWLWLAAIGVAAFIGVVAIVARF